MKDLLTVYFGCYIFVVNLLYCFYTESVSSILDIFFVMSNSPARARNIYALNHSVWTDGLKIVANFNYCSNPNHTRQRSNRVIPNCQLSLL